MGAVRAAEENAADLHTVADDSATTLGAFGSQGINGALEAVEHVRLSVQAYLEAFIVLITAYFTSLGVVFASEKICEYVFC
jgi:hypothetical protein